MQISYSFVNSRHHKVSFCKKERKKERKKEAQANRRRQYSNDAAQQ